MKVAIHQNKAKFDHSTSWSNVWIDYCIKNNIPYEIVDCYKSDIIDKLKGFDFLLWHFDQYVYTDMLFARSILYSAKKIGLKVFPYFNDAWHFDDKIAETYIFQSICAPTPKSYIFYLFDDVKIWADTYDNFPIVAKLRTGSGSHNVRLIKSKKELLNYAQKMLKKGYNPAPSLLYKTTSNIRSSHNWTTFITKAKRIPEFLSVLSEAKEFPNEKGYVYLQEFIPNDGYDMKVVVVGDKLSGFIRPVRNYDFRASGGGEAFFDKNYFTESIIKSAFTTADALGTQCIGFDYVVDKRVNEGLIVEMSYGFSNAYVLNSNGYFDRNYVWHDKPLNAPQEIIKNMLGNRNYGTENNILR